MGTVYISPIMAPDWMYCPSLSTKRFVGLLRLKIIRKNVARFSTRKAIVAIIWKPHFSDRSDHSISQRSLKSGFRMIATIAKRFHGSARSDRSDNTETSL